MFHKILIANRGARAEGADAQAAHGLAREACAGDFAPMEAANV